MNRRAQNLFLFESHYSMDLQFIPLIIRYRLDLNGLKVGLEAWQKIPTEDRFKLVGIALDSNLDCKNFPELLSLLTKQWFGQNPQAIEPVLPSLWSDNKEIASCILNRCSSISQPKLALKWKKLSELQRYVLFKLSTSQRQAEAFENALQEFLT